MTRRGPIGGGGRRHKWRRGGVPIRPLKWVSGADETIDDSNRCVAKTHLVHCEEEEGPTALEIVAGRSDLLQMDKQESTITRIVGQVSFSYSQYYSVANPAFTIPFVRLGLIANEGDVEPATWIPPDLWNRFDLENSPWMWLNQFVFDTTAMVLAVSSPPDFDQIIEMRHNVDVDCSINRKIGRDGSIFLVVSAHYGGSPALNVGAPIVGYVQNLRILTKN